MLLLAILAVLVALAAGLTVKLTLDALDVPLEITWLELIVASALIALVIVPLTTWAGWNIAKNNNLSFNEYWNGYELRADWKQIPCRKDGPCIHEYDCDPWIHIHTETYTDSNGNTQTRTYPHTHYHSCPYTTEEWTFGIDTTLGYYTIASHWLPTNPDSHRWRAGITVPSRLYSGIPEFWAAAKARIDAGKPGPVTKRMKYDNYILASDHTILKQYSDRIEGYRSKNLFPDVAHAIRDFYYADKAHFVGYEPSDAAAWQNALMRMNAALGGELQGDLHLVIVQWPDIDREPDAYITALKAYWASPKAFGDNALSKNAIIVLLGTKDGTTVAWARALTGMPLGNETMLVAIQNKLRGIPLTPESVIGSTEGQFYTKEDEEGNKKLKVRGVHDNGALEQILWGLEEPGTKFARVSMTGKDGDDIGGGFLYLASEIEPTFWQKFWIVFVCFWCALPVWVAVALIGERYVHRRRF